MAFGYAAVIAAVVIWAVWIVAVRDAVTGSYSPLDLSILRYCVPAALLFPIVLRKGLFPPGENMWLIAVMTVGWGGPFVLLISTGMQTVPASLFGPLVPGLLPMIVALWGVLIAGERLTRLRLMGLGFIAAAVALILGPALAEGDQGMLTGAPWLLAACCGWSAFTIAYRNTHRITGIEAAAYVCTYSTPFLILAALYYGSHLTEVPAAEIAAQALIQGVISGMASVAAYAYAVRVLGLPKASAFTSLVPALAAVLGWGWLGETVGLLGWLAVLAACIGVLLVNLGVGRGG